MELTALTYLLCTIVDMYVCAQGKSGCKKGEMKRGDVLCIL